MTIEEKKVRRFRLNLQTFAETGEQGTGAEGEEKGTGTTDTEQDNPNTSDETKNTGGQGESEKIPYDRFKQKVDEVNELKARLEKLEAEEAKKKQTELEEQERYKELYEEQLQKFEEAKEAQREQSKKTALVEAGYADEQIQYMLKLVEGDTDEEVEKSIEALKATFPTKAKYVDPSADNGGRTKPKTKDGEDLGKEAFKRLFEKGKLRGFKKD